MSVSEEGRSDCDELTLTADTRHPNRMVPPLLSETGRTRLRTLVLSVGTGLVGEWELRLGLKLEPVLMRRGPRQARQRRRRRRSSGRSGCQDPSALGVSGRCVPR
jgi:hypothetical protein